MELDGGNGQERPQQKRSRRPHRERWLPTECQHCGRTYLCRSDKLKRRKYCSHQCSSRATTAGLVAGLPVCEQQPDKWIWLLRGVVYRHTDVRPIVDSDAYQAAWLGLLWACRNYRETLQATQPTA